MKRRKTSRRFEKLNPMRRKLLKGIAQGKPIGQAGLEAGYSDPQSVNHALKEMRPRILAEMEKLGWSPEGFARNHLDPLLKANKTLYFSNQGIVTDKRVVKDNAVRLAAGDQYLKVSGATAPIPVQVFGVVVHELTERERQEAKESVEKLMAYEGESAEVVDGELEELEAQNKMG